jgi:hypothetical protein
MNVPKVKPILWSRVKNVFPKGHLSLINAAAKTITSSATQNEFILSKMDSFLSPFQCFYPILCNVINKSSNIISTTCKRVGKSYSL